MSTSKLVSALIMAVIVLSVAVPLYKLYGPKTSENHAGSMNLALPDFAQKSEKIMKAYELASGSRKEDFGFLTCHCGCGMHAMTHRGKVIPQMHNLRDCFIRDDGTWEDHAAMDCPYCVDLAVMADDLLSKGYTLKEIRNIIDTKYNQIDPAMRAMDMNPPMPE